MLYIFDREENLLEVLTEYEEFTYNKKLNSDRSLSFELEKNNNIKKYNKVGFFDIDKNFQLFFIDDIVSFKDAKIEKISVDCLADFFILANTLIDDKRATTIRDAAIKCLESSDYKIGIVEAFEDRNINFYHISRIKALNEIINTFKCEIDIRIEINESTGKIGNKFIDFKHRLGQDTAIRFTYDTALNNVEKSTLDGHFNVLWGWGKSLETEAGGFSRKLDFADINNGKKYVEDTESIAKYGRLEGIFEDSKIEDKTILLEKTKERLLETKQPKMSYKASIKDISNMTGYEHFKVDLGDTIAILDEDINEIIEARIISIKESEKDTILTLGNFLPALSDDDLDDILGNLNDKIDNLPKPEVPTIDTIFPDTLPKSPAVEATGLFSSVILSWTYENKAYYTYEVFASKIKDFKPSADNRIFEGKASSYLHEVNPAETWYYRIRAKNTYDNVTAYSTQVKAVTTKISDAAQYFEELAIGHALIHSLDLDKATVGKLKGQFIEAYNLIVLDGNGNKTLEIDDFGNIYMNVTELKILSKSVETEENASNKINIAKTDAISRAATDAQNKANKALSDAKNYTGAEIIKVNSIMSSKFAEIKTTTDSITQTVSNTNKEIETVKVNVTNAQSDAIKAISDAKVAKTEADKGVANALSAQNTANVANTNANTANTNANTANNKLTEIASDSKLTASEKQQTKKEWDAIVGEKAGIIEEAKKFGISYSDYESKYNTLNNYITPLLSNLTTTSDITGATFRSNFTNYYNSRQALLNAISTKAKSLADTAKTQADKGINDAKLASDKAIAAQSTANSANSSANSAKELAQAMSTGKLLSSDPIFKNSTGGIGAYNNSGGTALLVSRIVKPSDCPTTSTHCLEIKVSSSATSPYFGGFIAPINTRANARFIIRFIAKIPVGKSLSLHSNSIGTGGSDKLLTSAEGTDKYTEYIREIKCGSTGTFSSTGHFALKGGSTPSAAAPLAWQVALCEIYDITDCDYTLKDTVVEVTNVKNKTATLETNVNAITGRVSSVESTTSTLNGKVTTHESRITSAEQKITPSAIINIVSQTIDNKVGVVNNKVTEVTQNLEGFKVSTSKKINKYNLLDGGNLRGTDNTKSWTMPINMHWRKIGDNVGLGRGDNGNREAVCYSAPINIQNTGRQISISAKGFAENHTYGGQVFIIGSVHNNMAYDWTHWALGFDNNEGWVTKAANNIWIPDHINYITIRIDHEGKEGVDGTYFYLDWINVVKGDTAYTDGALEGNGFTEGITTINTNGVRCDFEDGSYASMGRNGLRYYKNGMSNPYQYITFNSRIAAIRNGHWRNVRLPDAFRGKQINHDFQLFVTLGNYNLNAYVSGSINGALRVAFAEWSGWDANNCTINIRPCFQKIGLNTNNLYGWDAGSTSAGGVANEGEGDVIIFAQM